MKPVNPEKLCTVLDRAAEGLKKPSRMVVLTVDGTAVRILGKTMGLFKK